jgi:ankyrin repeat protein|tara:strand:+ start:179 stop:370 length:192 start_codon:yes stop_codon:yes gene_type:complete
LLRRDADLNAVNISGCTVLHYCFAYHNEKLGDYFVSKGADDSIQNAEGLTCYEGLSREDLDGL